MEFPPPADGGDAEAEVVVAGGDVEGVFEPLAGLDEADVVAAAGVGGGFDVDAFGFAIGTAQIGFVGVVIGDAFAAEVVILGLDGDGDGTDDGRACRRRAFA